MSGAASPAVDPLRSPPSWKRPASLFLLIALVVAQLGALRMAACEVESGAGAGEAGAHVTAHAHGSAPEGGHGNHGGAGEDAHPCPLLPLGQTSCGAAPALVGAAPCDLPPPLPTALSSVLPPDSPGLLLAAPLFRPPRA